MMLLLHGWMDVSASFQFVVDELLHGAIQLLMLMSKLHYRTPIHCDGETIPSWPGYQPIE